MLGILFLADSRPKVVRSLKKHIWYGHTHRPGEWFSNYSMEQVDKGKCTRFEILSIDTDSMVVCTCNLRIPEAEAGRYVFKTSLNYKIRSPHSRLGV